LAPVVVVAPALPPVPAFVPPAPLVVALPARPLAVDAVGEWLGLFGCKNLVIFVVGVSFGHVFLHFGVNLSLCLL